MPTERPPRDVPRTTMEDAQSETVRQESLPPRTSNADVWLDFTKEAGRRDYVRGADGYITSAPAQPSVTAAPASKPPEGPHGRSPIRAKSSSFTWQDLVVLVAFECIALPICIAAGEAFVSGHYGRAIFGWAVGIPLAIAGATAHWWKEWLSENVRQRIMNHTLRWWPAAVFLAFLYVVGPEMYRRAIEPAATPAALVPTPTSTAQPIPTSLRLQFTAVGSVEEIDAKNIKWRALNPEEARLVQAPPFTLSCSNGESYIRKQGGGIITPVPSLIDPTFCLEKFKTWVFLLSFEKPITYKKIRANAHGATLPDWDNKGMTENSAVIWFHGELKNLVLTIEAVD